MKILILLFFGLSVGGCFALTPAEKARMACLDMVPKEVARAADGEIDGYQHETPLTLTKGDSLSHQQTLSSQTRCSPICQDAREERERIVSDCYQQWKSVHPTSETGS